MIDDLTRFTAMASHAMAEEATEIDLEVAEHLEDIWGWKPSPLLVAGWLSDRMVPDFAQDNPQLIALFAATVHEFASLTFWDGKFARDLFFATDTYVGGGLSVGLKDVEELDTWFQVSTFLRYYPLHNEKDAIWVKDYLENAGLMRRLVEIGYLKDMHESVQVDFGVYRKAIYLGRKDYSARAVGEYTKTIAEKLGIRG